MARKLIIIGASAMGRETFYYAQAQGYVVEGFLDSRSDILNGYAGYPPILGDAESYTIKDDDFFVCAVGDVNAKMSFVRSISSRGGQFVSVVHPSAFIGLNVKIGIGCIIAPQTALTADCNVEDHVIINVQSSVSHDCSIGCGTTISPGCHIAGWCTLGKNVFLGVGSSLIPHIKLGDGVFAAAGAIVTQSVSGGRVMGVPAVRK